jgi:hypothetical protein
MVGRRVGVGGRLGQLLDRPLVDAAPPPPGGVRVHHHPAHVGIDCAAVLNPAPRQVGLGQGLLQQVLGVVVMAGQEESGAQQRR